MPRRFRKRPIEVEAVLFDRAAPAEAIEFCGAALGLNLGDGYMLWVEQSHAWVDLEDRHWIIAERTEPGGFSPCAVASFEDAYEAIE